jgi:hypothetical protein
VADRDLFFLGGRVVGAEPAERDRSDRAAQQTAQDAAAG